MSELRRIWQDQANFNHDLRGDPPLDFKERSLLTKDIALNQYSEVDEMVRTTQWKSHRRRRVRPNPAHTLEELVDQFKLWMTQCQIWGFTMEEVFAAYWRKSAVVRHRYVEEWLRKLDGPCVIVDIDNVLADYVTGYCRWFQQKYPDLATTTERLIALRGWVDAESLGLDEGTHQKIKHEFRISGGKRYLPVFDGAREFLQACQDRGWYVILLTSRPIDRYPNMYTDTITWLQEHELPHDFVWWSVDKTERVLEEDIRKQVLFMVDDDLRHVRAFATMGVPTYWMQWTAVVRERREAALMELRNDTLRDRVTVISAFDEIPLDKFAQAQTETTHA